MIECLWQSTGLFVVLDDCLVGWWWWFDVTTTLSSSGVLPGTWYVLYLGTYLVLRYTYLVRYLVQLDCWRSKKIHFRTTVGSRHFFSFGRYSRIRNLECLFQYSTFSFLISDRRSPAVGPQFTCGITACSIVGEYTVKCIHNTT